MFRGFFIRNGNQCVILARMDSRGKNGKSRKRNKRRHKKGRKQKKR